MRTKSFEYVENKLNESIQQGKPDETIDYWRGYRDCAKAMMQDNFPDTTKMVPLTLEQLLELGEKAENGEKIIVYCTPLNEWCKVFKYGIMFFGTEDYRSWREVEETYERDWLAYAYPTANIDREAWKPCDACYKSCGNCGNKWGSKCLSCKRFEFWKPMYKYCKQCGRPMTEEAWAELEKRLRW